MKDLSSSLEKLFSVVEPESKIIRHWHLNGGISCTMIGVELELSGSESQTLVVRQVGKWSYENYPDSVYHEHQLLLFLQENGIPVPTPRYSDRSCEFLERPYLVLEYVEGSPDMENPDRMRIAKAMANQLADIHSLNRFHSVFNYLQPSKVKIRPAEGAPNETLQESKIRVALENAFPGVHENEYVFRHGDFWPGNMLWRDNELVAVIDWEETSVGDPLFDVAITRLDTLWAYGEGAMNEFTRQYQSRMDIDYAHLPFWDLRVSLRPITNIAVWATSFPPLGRPDVTEESMASGHRWFVDQAIENLVRR